MRSSSLGHFNLSSSSLSKFSVTCPLLSMENNTTDATTTTNNNNAKAGSEGPKPIINGTEERSNLNEEEIKDEDENGADDDEDDDDDDEEEEDEDDDEEEEEERAGSGSIQSPSRLTSRAPFSSLSQVDADLALARTLQEQERAYMMLRMNNEGSDYGSWEAGSYLHDDGDDFEDLHDIDDDDDHNHEDDDDDDDDDDDEDDDIDDGEEEIEDEYDNEDAFDAHAHASSAEIDNTSIEFDPDVYSSDEAYARALQEAEEREMAARLLALAGINDRDTEDIEDHGTNSQEAWEDVDPDELSYEQLLALGEVVGTESRGISTDTIASLPSIKFKTGSDQHGSNDLCVICRMDYEDGESLTLLSCKHLYHPECINNWLKINKVCPVCSAEVSASGSSL